ncbi:MAG TPA: hypothetical protein DHW85_05870 [Lachnospiraceae bacterium]|nr:hypothetical protein [Lachnospiraceae bacterium]
MKRKLIFIKFECKQIHCLKMFPAAIWGRKEDYSIALTIINTIATVRARHRAYKIMNDEKDNNNELGKGKKNVI